MAGLLVLTVMLSSDQRIVKALDILRKHLRNFVESKLREQYKHDWLEHARLSLQHVRESRSAEVNLDVAALIRIACDRQHAVLYESMTPKARNYLISVDSTRHLNSGTRIKKPKGNNTLRRWDEVFP